MNYIKRFLSASDYEDTITPLIFVGRVTMIAPFYIKKNMKRIKLKVSIPFALLSLLLLILYAVSVGFVTFSGETLGGRYFVSPFLKMCNQLRIVLSYSLMTILVIKNFMKKNIYETIANSLKEIDSMMRLLGISKNFNKIRLNHIILVFTFESIHCLYVLTSLGTSLSLTRVYSIGMLYVLHYPPFSTTGTLIIFAALINILRTNLLILHKELLKVCQKQSFIKSEKPLFVLTERILQTTVLTYSNEKVRKDNLIAKLRIIFKVYDKICYCAENINEFFTWNMLAILSLSFIAILFNMFYLLNTLILIWNNGSVQDEIAFLFYCTFQCLSNLLVILIIVLSCFKCDVKVGFSNDKHITIRCKM